MKTAIISPKTKFQPITIEITFETPEEADLVDKMLRANLRIPELLAKDKDIEPDKVVILTRIMGEIRNPIYKEMLNQK